MGRVFTNQFYPNSMLHARSITSSFKFAAGPAERDCRGYSAWPTWASPGLPPAALLPGPGPNLARSDFSVCQWARAAQAETPSSFPWRGAGVSLATARGPS
jgi:hypothetical protein